MTTAVRAEFSAPWSRSLRAATSLCVALLVLLLLVGLLTGPRQLPVWRVVMLGLPLLLLLGTPLFMVRGYQLTDTDIRVLRLGWFTVLPLAGITSITGEPEGLRGSVRLFGVGGTVRHLRLVLEPALRPLSRLRHRSRPRRAAALPRRPQRRGDSGRRAALHRARAHAGAPRIRRRVTVRPKSDGGSAR